LAWSPQVPSDINAPDIAWGLTMRTAFLVIGIIATLLGLVWIGQGTGYFPYPKQSFMINQMPWVYRGIALAVVGLGLIWYSRR
jgi:heme/copper-type cytochrome/quinol oxidase subunit 1